MHMNIITFLVVVTFLQNGGPISGFENMDNIDSSGKPTNSMHPVLWFDQEQLKNLKIDIRNFKWKQGLFGNIKNEADSIIALEFHIPEDGAVITPECFPAGVQIIRKSETEYYSKVEDKINTGSTVIRGQGKVILHNFPFKQFFYNNTHHMLAHYAKILAFTYAITGQAVYAEKCKEIIVGYANNFSTGKYPVHKYDGSVYEPDPASARGYGGRVTHGALEESFWVYHMMCAFDWSYSSGLYSEAEKALIGNMFFIEYETINNTLLFSSKHNWKNNHSTAQNLARMTFGILTGNTNIINDASNGSMGFVDLLDSAMNSEGRTEGYGVGYHFAFLHSLAYTAEIHKRSGYGDLFLYNNGKFKTGIDFIINSTYLDGLRIPQYKTSHSDWNWTPAFQTLFEIGYNHYKDINYLVPILDELIFLQEKDQKHNYKKHFGKWGNKHKRGTYTQLGGPHYIEALIIGESEVTAQKPVISLPSIHFAESKKLFLRKGDSKTGISVFLSYSDGGHHSDVGGFQFFALGRELGRESGMAQSYDGEDYGGWFSQRVAHNCVVIDQYSPGLPPHYGPVGPSLSTFGTGVVTEFTPDPHNPRAVLTAPGTIYPEVNMTRDIRIGEGKIYILDSLASASIRTYDWAYRNEGEVLKVSGVDLYAWDGELGEDYGYSKKYIFNIRRGKTDSNINISYVVPPTPMSDKKICVDLEIEAHPDTEVIIGDAYWQMQMSVGPILLVRRITDNTTYRVHISPYYID